MPRHPLLNRFSILLFALAISTQYLWATANAGFSYQAGCNGAVTFTATQQGYTSYSWYFGDNSSGTGSPAQHQYTPGTYTATLIVQNGTSYDSASQQIYISDYINQQITGPLAVCSNGNAYYTLSNITGNFQYSWLVSSGDIVGSSHSAQVQVAFNDPGNAVVSVIISNGFGCDSIIHQNIQVQATPHLVLAGQSTDSMPVQMIICQNTPVWYNVVSTSGSNGVITWSCGNGITLSPQGVDSMLFSFPTAGTTYIQATELTSAGCADTVIGTVVVTESPTVSATGANACLGSDNYFTATVNPNNPTTYLWSFDDGGLSYINPATHTFANTGTHLGAVIATNQYGCRDTALTSVQVDATAGPAIECVGPVCAGDEVVYSTATVAGVNYHWTITGGTITADGTLTDHTVKVHWSNGAMGTIQLYLTGPGIYCQFPTIEQVQLVGGALAITGDATPCLYELATYSTDIIPGGLYNWTVTNGSINSGQGTSEIQIYFSGATPGTVSVQVNHQILTCSSHASFPVTPLDKFQVYAAQKTCVGAATTINTYQNNSFNWTAQGGTIVSGNGTGQLSVIWNTPGTYTITATNNTDFCNTQAQTTITVVATPLETITGPDKTCNGSNEMYNISPDMLSYLWTVNGGGTIVGANSSNAVNIQWTTPGTHTVQLIYHDINSCTYSVSYNVTVAPQSVPAFTGDTVVCYGTTETYTFTAVSGVDYVWETQGGVITAGQGTGTVSVMWLGNQIGLLRLRNAVCNNFIQKNIVIRPTPLVHIQPLNLNCTGSSADLKVVEDYPGYLWNNALTTQTIHITAPNTYTVTATDAFGCSGTGSINASPIPNLGFTNVGISVSAPSVPIPYAYLVLTAYGTPTPVSYLWNTGNQEASEYITSPGTYTVTMTNEYGCTAVASAVATATACNGVSYGSGGTNLACPGLSPVFTTNNPVCNPVQFTPGTIATYYHWNFNDGVMSTLSNPTHRFTSPGTKTVEMAYSNDGTNWYICNQTLVITSVIDISFNETGGCKGAVVLTNTSTSVLPITSVNWQLGDGNTATGNVVNYQYANNASSYNVTLSVNDGVCTDNLIETIHVNQLATAFVFTGICTDNPALFNDATAHSELISSYSWTFGNGEAADYRDPVTYYHPAGPYAVSLTIKDADGCLDTHTQNVTVNDFAQPTILAGGPLAFCKGGSVTLGLPFGNQYYWNTSETTNTIHAAQTGPFYAWVTDATTGCSGFSDTAHVTVHIPPRAFIANYTGQTELCEGEHLNLQALANGNVTWLWQFNNAPSNTGPYISYWYASPNNSGDYSVILNDANGCKDTSDVIHIIVHPKPAYPVITESPQGQHCQGDPVTLSVTGTDIYLWTTGAYGSTISPQQSGYYQVIATNNFGCTNSSGTYVTFDPLPDMRYFPTGCYQICQNANITVTGPTGMATYHWSNGASSAGITLTTTGDYSLSATSFAGCSASSASFHVDVFDAGNIQLGNDTFICPGQTVLLDAGSYTSFLWQDNSTNQTFTVTDTGTYHVQVPNNNGCVSGDTIHVGSLGSTFTLGNDTFICPGTSIVLDAGLYTSYLWQDNSTAQTFTVTDTGSYHVQVTSAGGCTAADTIHITNVVAAFTLGNDTLVCPEPFFVLDAGIFNSYLWQDNSTNQTFTVADTGTYYVQVTSAGGCVASDTIHVQALSVALNLGNDTTLCNQGTILISPQGSFAGIVWQDNSTGSTYTATDTGWYYATATTTAGCKATDSLHISGSPLSSVNLPATDSLCDRQVTISVIGPYSSYVWSTGATGASITVSSTGSYSVTVNDENGCTSADTTQVVACDDHEHECDNQFLLPNAFTPNGDGNNDRFLAIRRPDSHSTHFFQMSIYNRWGEKVFETYNENAGWDGKFQGQDLGPEVLVYSVRFVCDNESILKKGTVTLLR